MGMWSWSRHSHTLHLAFASWALGGSTPIGQRSYWTQNRSKGRELETPETTSTLHVEMKETRVHTLSIVWHKYHHLKWAFSGWKMSMLKLARYIRNLLSKNANSLPERHVSPWQPRSVVAQGVVFAPHMHFEPKSAPLLFAAHAQIMCI